MGDVEFFHSSDRLINCHRIIPIYIKITWPKCRIILCRSLDCRILTIYFVSNTLKLSSVRIPPPFDYRMIIDIIDDSIIPHCISINQSSVVVRLEREVRRETSCMKSRDCAAP